MGLEFLNKITRNVKLNMCVPPDCGTIPSDPFRGSEKSSLHTYWFILVQLQIAPNNELEVCL